MRRPLLAALAASLLLPSAAPAQSWVSGAVLSSAARDDAVVTAGPGGEVVAVWEEEDRIAGALLRPGAAGFGAPFTVARTERDADVRAAIGPDGRLTVAWREGEQLGSNPSADVTVRAVAGRPEQRFSAVQVVDAPQRHRGLGLAVGPDGVAYVAYGRRAPDANRIDLFVATRAAGADAFAPERLVHQQITSGPSSAPVALAPGPGGAVLAFHARSPVPQPVVAEVDASGATRGEPLTLERFTYPVPAAVALGDGTVAVTDPGGEGGGTWPAPRVRLRAPGGAFGAPQALPGTGPIALAAAGRRLVAVTGERADGGGVLASVGLPGAFASRSVLGDGEVQRGVALAGAGDGRALVVTSTSRGVSAALAPAGAGFDAPQRVLSGTADEVLGVAGALGRDVAVVAIRIGGVLRTVLRGRAVEAVGGDGGAGGGGAPGAGGGPGRATCTAGGRRRDVVILAGRSVVTFRAPAPRVRAGARLTLRLRALQAPRSIRRVELRAGGRRVRDARAPYRLAVPRALTRRPGTRTLRVRLVTRGGTARSATVRFRVVRCR